MRKIVMAGAVASVMTTVLSGAVIPLATVPQQNAIAQKKSCNPDACIKTVRQKGLPFATAAAWCAKNNNGC